MPLPVGVPRVTVSTGPPLVSPGGTPLQGRLIFVGPDLVVVPSLDLTLDGAEAMDLAAGVGLVDLIPSDIADMNPRGWTYEVRSDFTNAPNWVRYIRLTLAMAGTTVNLADVLVPDPVTGAYTTLIDPSTLGGAAFADIGTAAGTVAAGEIDGSSMFTVNLAYIAPSLSGTDQKIYAGSGYLARWVMLNLGQEPA